MNSSSYSTMLDPLPPLLGLEGQYPPPDLPTITKSEHYIHLMSPLMQMSRRMRSSEYSSAGLGRSSAPPLIPRVLHACRQQAALPAKLPLATSLAGSGTWEVRRHSARRAASCESVEACCWHASPLGRIWVQNFD